MTAPMTREELATDEAMIRARALVERHIAVFGYVPNPDKIKEAIAAELRAGVAQTSGWQPIATAPPAGTVIDVWMVLPSGYGARWTRVMWAPNAERWISGPPSQDEKGWKATHWQPLPAPPSNQGASK